ncbi:MAG: hypothetical protein IPN20_00355 [Haliscomenobacter sp.]|nr:hypothetical protein [Haliscomenobacter sp.]
MNVLTVKEAVERVNKGESLKDVVLDESTTRQVNVRDAMVLSMGGIVIPEQNIYYNDEDIVYDEDIDELVITSGVVQLSWEEKAQRAKAYSDKANREQPVTVDLSTHQPEIDDWIEKNKQKLETLLKPIVVSLYQAEKAVRE